MTNEEAIEQFQNAVDLIKQNGKDWLDERDIPMLEMAINALKQTDGDLISRTDLLNKIFQQAEGRDYYGHNMLDLPYVDLIKSMPTITVEPTEEIKKLVVEGIKRAIDRIKEIPKEELVEILKKTAEPKTADGDLISRQAVLDLFGDIHPMDYNARAYVTQIKELPSAEKTAEVRPMQVELEADGYADGELVYDFAKCPKCGWEFEEDDKDWEEPYCCHCGQKLKWFENEEEG